MAPIASIRTRRQPEDTVLHQVLATHLETFLGRIEHDDARSALPFFVRRELREFLRCGILAHGFLRVHCSACGKDDLVAFSCKGRGFCPSCGSRRMVDTAAWLTDRVLPHAPTRQWVLALPHRARYLCAYDPDLCAGVRRIVVRAISSSYRRRAREAGIEDPRTGCVVFTQRFDSALRLNLHFHTLWPDGVFTCAHGSPHAGFHPSEPLADADVAELAATLRHRILRYLRKRGALAGDAPDFDMPALATLAAAAVQGRDVLGSSPGAQTQRLGRGSEHRDGEFRRGKLCADVDGFSLHAGVLIPDYCRDKLEKLCRYAARPPVVHARMSLTTGGKVLYKLKRKFRDGSTHVVLDPLDLIARLAALIPRPRVHLVNYFGVFAPAASYRDRVVPPAPEQHAKPCAHAPTRTEAGPAQPPAAEHATVRARYSWAELMRRVFELDVLICQHCGGKRKLLDATTEPAAIRRVLEHLGLPTDAPVLLPARAPPTQRLPFGLE